MREILVASTWLSSWLISLSHDFYDLWGSNSCWQIPGQTRRKSRTFSSPNLSNCSSRQSRMCHVCSSQKWHLFFHSRVGSPFKGAHKFDEKMDEKWTKKHRKMLKESRFFKEICPKWTKSNPERFRNQSPLCELCLSSQNSKVIWDPAKKSSPLWGDADISVSLCLCRFGSKKRGSKNILGMNEGPDLHLLMNLRVVRLSSTLFSWEKHSVISTFKNVDWIFHSFFKIFSNF